MFKILLSLILVAGLGYCNKSYAQNLPSGSVGVVSYSTPGTYQNYSYSFTASTTGANYLGLAFRQDPGYWSIGNFSVTASNSSTNLLLNPALQYGGSLTVNTTNYGQMNIQAPSDWGVWYQNGTYPAAAGMWYGPGSGWMGSTSYGLGVNTSSAGSWIDGAVGSFDGIYQGFYGVAGTTYSIKFSLNGTQASSNPSIEIGVYAGTCGSGSNVYNCTVPTTSGFTTLTTPASTQTVGGAPSAPASPPGAADPFTTLKFSKYQVADTQWNVSACTQTASCQIYSKNPGVTYESGSPVNLGATQYIGFLNNTGSDSSTNPWTMVLYNSDGSVAQTLGTGRILVEGYDSLGNGYFFFTNNNYNGTLFSINFGMNDSSGLTFNGTASPTTAQTNTYAGGGSTSPLASGASGGTPQAPQYSSSITAAESALMISNQTAAASLTANKVYIDQIGNNDRVTVTQNTAYNSVGGYTQTAMPIRGGNNTITIRQGDANNSSSTHNMMQVDILGGGANTLNLNQGTDTNGNSNGTDTGYHFLGLQINGSSNSVTTQQQTTHVGVGNYAQISITGNANNVGVYQTGSAAQQSFNNVNGNSNTLSVTQSGTSTHFSDVTLTGNSNSATINQSNTGTTGSNAATIVLNNAGGPTSLNLTQTGGQVYSINQTCTNAAGCGTITVRQGN